MTYFCANKTQDYVYYSSYLTLISSCLSIFGSFLIILTFILWKDVRQSVARIILLFLALADLGTGLGYLISSTGYIINHHTYDHDSNDSNTTWYHNFCIGTSFVTTFFPVSSFFWTAYLAVYFFVTLVLVRPHWGRKLLIIFNLTAWPIPLVICIFAVSFGVLGGAQYRANGAWCFVALYGRKDHYHYNYTTFLLLEASVYKIWELLLLLIVITCYTAIFCINRKYCQCFKRGQLLHKAISKIDWKLFFIPLMFIVIRLPGTYRYFISMAPSCHPSHNHTCHGISHDCFELGGNYYILFVQALLDPIQGFGNAVLYLLLSKSVVRQVCWRLAKTEIIRKYFYDWNERDEDGNENLIDTTKLLPPTKRSGYSSMAVVSPSGKINGASGDKGKGEHDKKRLSTIHSCDDPLNCGSIHSSTAVSATFIN